MKKIGILGSGLVAHALGKGFLNHGYEVMLSSRDKNKLSDWQQIAGAKGKIGSFEEAAKFGDIVVLSVKGTAAANVIEAVGPQNLTGKTVIDTTNPIADGPPEDGVIRFFTSFDESLMEDLQSRFPALHFVKAFNSVGNAYMVNPHFKNDKPSMFICGNNEAAKKEVTAILDQFGWDVEDMGKAAAARAIEPLSILWCIPGINNNEWSHAFKLLRA